MLSQTNRDGWKYAAKHDGNYQLNALAEANELERDANIVLSIFTDEILINTNQALVKICKSRDTGAMEEAISTDIFAKTYMFPKTDFIQPFKNTKIQPLANIQRNVGLNMQNL